MIDFTLLSEILARDRPFRSDMIIVLLGLLSGALSGLLSDQDTFVLPGVLFALAILIGSRTRFARVGILRALALMAMSAGANYVAVRCATAVNDLHFSSWTGDVLQGSAAGLAGSLLLAVALRLTLRMKPLLRTLVHFALAGTAAGALFFFMPNLVLGYALWQTAIACVIARAWAATGR